jgi:Ran GTPase-activating protein (RanGAP) involved in mRNA processing and transport
MDRMGYVGVFNMNKETGIGELDVSGKRLLPADLEVVIEVLKRYTEIQTVTMKRCAISDDMFEKLMEGLTKARHIKRLDLSLNLLTVRSFTLLREHFSSLERRLEVMDLRLNSMTERDGVNLYRSFPYLQLLNGMKLCDVRDDKSKSVLDFSGIMMGRAEMAIMCDLLLECPHIEAIDVSRNTLDTYCLKYLADRLIYKTHVHKVNVSQNPIFKPKDNMLGLEMLLEVCQQTTHMWDVVLEGIEVPEELQKALTTSLMVNRSMRRNTFDTYFYNDIAGKVRAAAGPPREDPNADWKPQLDIDRRFCVRYKVPETTIEVEDGEIKIVRALDEVTLKIQERKRRGAAAARARAEAK